MELYDILMADDVEESILDNQEKLFELIPELKFTVGFNQKNPHHHLDVFEHTLCALNMSASNFEIRLVLLLHDIGKPFSCQEDGEIRHFKGHANVSSEMAFKILTRLHFNKEFIEEVCYLIKYHDTPLNESKIKNNILLSKKLFEIQCCDALAHHPNKLEKRKKYLERTGKLIKRYNK